MSCKITKASNGKINNVLDQSNRPSELFKEILNTPTLSLLEAVETYKNIYGNELKGAVKMEEVRFSKSSEMGTNPLTFMETGDMIQAFVNGIFIGSIELLTEKEDSQGRKWKSVDINIESSQRDKGYSKYLYERALESLERQGFEGIISYDALLQTPVKSIGSRKNFKSEVISRDNKLIPSKEEQFKIATQGLDEIDIEFLKEDDDWYFDKVTLITRDNNDIRFSKNSGTKEKTADREIIDRLKQSGLAENVFEMTSEEINTKLEELGVDAETRKQVIAYHGSPYSFDKFSLSAMGTGEGAQAFGWGLYFADLESIARAYADNLAIPSILLNGTEVDYNEDSDLYQILLSSKLDVGTALYEANQEYKVTKNEELLTIIETLQEAFSKGYKVEQKGNKNLYKVNLHKGKTPSEYSWLEWDKNISQHQLDILKQFEGDHFKPGLNYKGRTTYERLSKQLQVYNDDLTSAQADKEASLLLLRVGIDGIKYPAETLTRGTTSDTARGTNYVVFDENAITIEEQVQFSKQLSDNGIKTIVNGFVHNNNVYLNSETMSNETALHEFSHLFNAWAKNSRPEIYAKGIELIKEELEKENSDIQDVIQYVRDTQPNLKGEAFYEELLTEVIGRSELLDKKGGLAEWLKDLWKSLGEILGITNMSPKQISELSLKQYSDAVVSDVLSGNKIEQAQEYFTREADRLPLTLAVFERPEFKKLQGKDVNPITVLNSLNQTGIKQIEKELIKNIIEQNYQGQKKISYDELEATVRANIMPLERIFTTSYADYGMDNLGSGNYGNANTIILNAPIEHGVTGHFSNDFKASGRKNVKYVPKQLNDNTWVAVEEGYEAQANNNNIYQFVGTAGTKEVVDSWITDYENPLKDEYTEENVIFDIDRRFYNGAESLRSTVVNVKDKTTGKQILTEESFPYETTEENIKRQSLALINNRTKKGKEVINKGMFAHMRVWQDGDVFYVAEAQSDYFQKNNARQEILDKVPSYVKARQEKEKSETDLKEKRTEKVLKLVDAGYGIVTGRGKNKTLPEVFIRKNSFGLPLGDSTNVKIEKVGDYYQIQLDGKSMSGNYFVDVDVALAEIVRARDTERYDSQNIEPLTLDDIPQNLKEDFKFVTEGVEKETKKINKDFNNVTEKIIQSLPKDEKQFIASQKEWEKRLLREALKEASLSGSTSMRLPTPYTLSVIEGYVKSEVGMNTMPYEIIEGDIDLVTGDVISMGGVEYIVINNNQIQGTIQVVEKSKVIEDKDDTFLNEEYEYSEEQKVLDGKFITLFYKDSDSETLNAPSKYDDDMGTVGKEDFLIGDLSEVEQTVARKYEELARLLTQERGEGNVETVTDENGFDWYETKLTEGEVNTPVVAFQKAIEPNLTYQTPAGENYSTYREALMATPEGEISLQIEGVEVARVNSDTDIRTYSGTLNFLVKQGVLSGERTLEPNGDEVFKVNRETFTAKHLTAGVIEEVAVKLLGQRAVKITATGDMMLSDNLNKRTINGVEILESELAEMNYEQLKDKFGEEQALTIEVSREWVKSLLPATTKRRIDDSAEVKTEDELTTSIMSLLTKLGVKVTSIEDYQKNNKIKNDNVPMEAEAFMDIVNKVMAFRDGNITQEDLIEETMHLIEASLDPKLTEGVRKNIHKTKEWAQFSDYYRQIYSREYSGDKLEEVVRREILGKVMANAVATNFALTENASLTEQSIFEKIRELLQSFFDKVEMYFKPEYQTQIDNLNKDIYVKLMAGTLENDLILDQEYGTKLRLYSASKNISNELVQVQRLTEESLGLLRTQASQIGKKNASQRNAIKSAEDSLGRVTELISEIDKAVETQTDATKQADKQLIEANEALAKAELTLTLTYITNIAQKQVAYLQRAVKKNADKSHPFSSEEESVYSTLIMQFDNSLLPAIKNTLENIQDKTKGQKQVLEEVIKVAEDVNKLKGSVGMLKVNAKDHLVDILQKRLNLTNEQVEFVKAQVDGTQKETNFFFENFGTLMHSSNVYLNAAAHVITKTVDEANQMRIEDGQTFISELSKAKYLDGKKVKELIKDGHLENIHLDKQIQEKTVEKEYELYKEISGDKTITQEEFEAKPNRSELTPEQRSELVTELGKWQIETYQLSSLSPSELLLLRDRLSGYSTYTQNYERNYSSEFNDIMQEAELVEGVTTFTEDMKIRMTDLRAARISEKSPHDRFGEFRSDIEIRTQEEYELSKIEANKSKPTILVEGVAERIEIEGDILEISKGLYISLKEGSTDTASIASFELNKIDNRKIAENKVRYRNPSAMSTKFRNIVENMSPIDAYDFMMLNAYVGYTSEYYDQQSKPSVMDKLEKVINDETSELSQDDKVYAARLIAEYIETSKKQNVILQQNKDINNPSEVLYDRMDLGVEVRAVQDYATRLEAILREVNKFLPKQEVLEEEAARIAETVKNKAFDAYVASSDVNINTPLLEQTSVFSADQKGQVDTLFRIISVHSTSNSTESIVGYKSTIKRVAKGEAAKMSKMEARIFSKTLEEYSEMSSEEIEADMTKDLLRYAYTKLFPYFRKSRPIGADIVLEDLQKGNISSKEFFEEASKPSAEKSEKYRYLQVSPNYHFDDGKSDNRDPHFKFAKNNMTPLYRTFEAGVTAEDLRNKSPEQLKKEGLINQFTNIEFLKEYDIDLVKLFETGVEEARSKSEKFAARKAFIELQKKTIARSDKEGHNLYKLPQKERSKFRKFEEAISGGKGIRAILDEAINFREDESELGQDIDFNMSRSLGVKAIPKYGFNEMKSTEVTDEILESYLWMNGQSATHKARTENIGDMLAIKEALISTPFEGDLNAQSTRVYKMFEDTMSYNFFGVKEVFSKQFSLFNGRIKGDWGKILRSFGEFIRFRNLGFTIISPITSALTGFVQARGIERNVGEILDKDGLSEGNKFFRKYSGGAMREIFSLEGKSELNAIGSRWGFYDFEERYKNSAFGKSVRAFGQSTFISHTAANFPVNTPVGLSVLADSKFSDGKILSFRQFYAGRPTMSEKEARAEWRTMTSVLDVTKVTEEGIVDYDYPRILTALDNNSTLEEAQALMKNSSTGIRSRIKSAIQRVDTQISAEDRSMASRNAFLSFIPIHRSWLFLGIQNRLKGKQLSFASSNYEQGSWVNVGDFIGDVYKNLKNGNSYRVIEEIKKQWNSADELTRINVKRTAVEFGILNATVALFALFANAMDDDKDDSYALKVGTLFSARLMNEVNSSTIGLPENVIETLNGLIVGLNSVNIALDLPHAFSEEKVKGGRYRGLTERQAYLYKHIPIMREYSNLGVGIEGNISSYRHYNINDSKALDLTLFPMLVNTDEK